MAIAQNFPTISPSLLLDFANVQALDPRITYARASTATYYGTRTALAEQNLLLQSQTFDNASWAKTGLSVTADSTTAPDGTTTAETITGTSTTNGVIFNNAGVSVTANVCTNSIFIKAGTADFGVISIWTGSANNGANVWFNAQTGALTGSTSVTAGYTITSSSSTAINSGWFRITISATVPAATLYLSVRIVDTDNAYVYTNTVGKTLLLWGAQLEQRSTVTAYTPTTTQPITNYIPTLETAASGVARFDHNPTTFESLGLLIEQQSTNLLTYSEQFDNAAWTKLNSTVTANTFIAPDGTLTGDLFIPNVGAASGRLSRALSQTGVITVSVYAKANGITGFRFGSLGNGGSQQFNLLTGQLGATTGIIISAEMIDVGNGVYRCVATWNQTVSNTLYIDNNGFEVGNGYSGIYIWGAQLEALAFPTSYIQTVASQVTRAADSATMTGTNFSSWYNQAQGSIYAEVTTPVPASVVAPGFIWYATDGTANNRIELRQQNSGDASPRINTLFRVSAVTTVNMTVQTTTIGWTANNIASAKITLGYQVNDVYLTSDKANAAVTDLDTTMPPISDVLFSHTGHYKKLSYYPLRLSNTNLQALTG